MSYNTRSKIGRVAIIGYALDKYVDESPGDQEDMGFHSAKRAMKMARIDREEITSVHSSTMDFFDGVTISQGILLTAGGAYNRDSTRIQNGGLFSLFSACASILSGKSEVAVVISADAVEVDTLKVGQASTHYFLERPLGLNQIKSYALLSNLFMEKYNLTEEIIHIASAKNYEAGEKNEYSQIKSGYSIDDVRKSQMVSYPLRLHDVVSGPAYGAATIILTSEERAKQYTNSPIWITGFGASTNSINFDNLYEMLALKKAARQAYEYAGVKEPANDLDVVELDNPFSPFEIMAYEALGICEKGGAIDLLNNRITWPGGKLPVNPSGGTLCTNASNSGGLFRALQAAMYIEKKGKGKAAVHDSDMVIGIGGDSHAVMILEKEEK